MSFQFTGEGAAQSHTFNFVDKAGNTNSVTVSGISIDLTKPTATVTVPPADSWGWYDAPVTVSYAPTDALSGVDGAKSDPLSFVFSSEGAAQSHTFSFVDKAGNTNTVTVSGVNIDLTKPTATVTVPAANANGWYDAPVTVSYAPTDALSGVDGAKSDPLSFVFSSEGSNQSHTFNFVDKAGNTNTISVTGINIDLTPPTGTIVVDNNALFTNNPAGSVVLSFVDPGPGSGLATMTFSTDGGSTWAPPVPYGPSATVLLSPARGSQPVLVQVTDLAGNIGAAQSAPILLDLTPPTIVAPPNQIFATADPAGTVVNYVAGTAVDNSGLPPTVTYSPTDGTFFPVGTTPVLITAVDEVGNTATASFNVIVTMAPPPPIVALAPGQDTGLSASDEITNINDPQLIASDAESPVSFAYFVAPASSLSSLSGYTGQSLPEGVYDFTAVATDGFGNSSQPSAPLQVTIDHTAPVVTAPANQSFAATTRRGRLSTS